MMQTFLALTALVCISSKNTFYASDIAAVFYQTNCAECTAFPISVLSPGKREMSSEYYQFLPNENRKNNTSGRMHEASVVSEKNQSSLRHAI